MKRVMVNMNRVMIASALMCLVGCSTEGGKQVNIADENSSKVSAIESELNAQKASGNPEMTITKQGYSLNLVRVMDGAACKNELEGAKGTFLMYASPIDIERIKKNQGNQIFSEFAVKIQTFAEQALQEAVENTNLAKDPFDLSEEISQQKLVKELSSNFQNYIAEAEEGFTKETSLTIAIKGFLPSFTIFQQGCNATLPEADSDEFKAN
ncbi:MAG: hypothetical protein LAC70_04245 [Methylovulum sp.]|jgi:hypothetical protein|nr:hypothetical protein [Methylovulum sp.]